MDNLRLSKICVTSIGLLCLTVPLFYNKYLKTQLLKFLKKTFLIGIKLYVNLQLLAFDMSKTIIMKNLKTSRVILTVLLFAIGINSSFSQAEKKKSKKDKSGKDVVKLDSIADLNKPQSYDKVITSDAVLLNGVFTVAKVKNRYFFEIPNEVLNRDFQVTTRIEKGPALFMKRPNGSSGKILESTQIKFAKAPNDKLFIYRFVYDEMATDSLENGLYKALQMNNLQPVMSSFPIKAYGKNSVVIDVTDYINSDLEIFTGDFKEIFRTASFQADRSYVKKVDTLPMSIEISTVKTYEDDGKSYLTTEFNTSFLLLPKQTMRIRYSDDRVGYSGILRTDLDQDPQRIKKVETIYKWRLEPKAEDMARYAKGELVEPQKPIVFLISPTTPKKWVPYIKRAVNDWQPAFEKAGFKNAIYAKEATVADSIWNSKNGGMSTINYAATMASDIAHSIITDPRSGEILQANIQINHNVLYALYKTYLVQAGAIDKRAQKNKFSDELMGELLRSELCSHVGSTLGLLKNAGAASTVPIARLRDKKWTAEHGISPSIMQNTLFNYVAQPEDNIPQDAIIGKVGQYDKWAISWGYKLHPEIKDLLSERNYLRKVISDSLQANPQLYYGAMPKENEAATDPRNLPNSLGDDTVEASKLGIKNLKLILPNLPKWASDDKELYSSGSSKMSNAYSSLWAQYLIYLDNVAAIFGTYCYNPHDLQSTQKTYSSVSLEKQKKAMAFLQTELFLKGPEWLIPESVTNLSGSMPYNNDMYNIGTIILNQTMLDLKRLKNINTTAERFGAGKTYSLVSYFNDLDAAVWSELNSAKNVSSYHMVLQKMYLNAVNTIIDTPRDITNTLVIGTTRGNLIELKKKVINSLKLISDKRTKSHYLDILAEIDRLTDPKRVISAPVVPADPNAKKSINAGLDFWKTQTVEY